MDSLIVDKYLYNLKTQFHKQRLENVFVDLQIIGYNGSTWAHKALLAYYHPFWKQILIDYDTTLEDQVATILIPDEDIFVIEKWLNEIYTRQPPILKSESPRGDCNAEVAIKIIKKSPIRKQKVSSKPQKKEFKCDECTQTFNNMKTYYSHTLKHKPEKWNFKCPMCDQKCQTRRHLLLHKSKVHQEGICCPQCGKTYSSDSNLKYHILNVHQATRKFTCEDCGKVFGCKTYLKSHRKIHSSISTERTCPYCSKSIRGRYYYQHVKSHDQSTWKYQCPQCDQKCQTRTKYQEHQSLFHSAEPKFTCDLCQEKFKTTTKRSLHKKTCQGKEEKVNETNDIVHYDIINESLISIT